MQGSQTHVHGVESAEVWDPLSLGRGLFLKQTLSRPPTSVYQLNLPQPDFHGTMPGSCRGTGPVPWDGVVPWDGARAVGRGPCRGNQALGAARARLGYPRPGDPQPRHADRGKGQQGGGGGGATA